MGRRGGGGGRQSKLTPQKTIEFGEKVVLSGLRNMLNTEHWSKSCHTVDRYIMSLAHSLIIMLCNHSICQAQHAVEH